VGLVAGDGDDIEGAGCLMEDSVHLLQGSVSSFRVEEVDNGEDERIAIRTELAVYQFNSRRKYLHDSKDDICLILDRIECNRRDHDNHKVEDPVTRGCKCVSRSTNSQRHLSHY
jgi:hypothetical protein